jgi:hypothetical protein
MNLGAVTEDEQIKRFRLTPDPYAMKHAKSTGQPECYACAHGIQLFADDGYGGVWITRGHRHLDSPVLPDTRD